MKKILALILAMVMLLTLASPAMAANDIKVVLSGQEIEFDVPPQIIKGRTMVPLRAIFEALGASVEWDGATRTVTSTKGDTTISLTVDKTEMTVNGKKVTLDSPACIVGGRTLVPVRAISEAFKLKVEWDGATRTVKITKIVLVRTEDSNGYVESYENGKPTKYMTSDGKVMYTYTYDDNGYLIKMDSGEYWTKYINDANGNVLRTEDPTGVVTTYTYDSNGNCIREEFGGSTTTYTYDGNGNCVYEEQISNYGNSYKKYTYDANGNCVYEEWSSGDWYKYTYDEKGNCVYTESTNNFWGKSTYDEYGNQLTFENSSGFWRKYIYIEL